jgi:hypothetical protein
VISPSKKRKTSKKQDGDIALILHEIYNANSSVNLFEDHATIPDAPG